MTTRLQEIQERCEKATKGPWRAGRWGGQCHIPEHVNAKRHPGPPECKYDPIFYEGGPQITADVNVSVVGTTYDELEIADADVDFIVHARQDVPWLLQQLADASSRLATLEGEQDKSRRLLDFYRALTPALEAKIATLEGEKAALEAEIATLRKGME